jgi:hypothetical protein
MISEISTKGQKEIINMEIKRYLIKKIPIRDNFRVNIPFHAIENLKVESIPQFYCLDEYIHRFETFLAGDTKRREILQKTKVPLTWWDHVKQKFAPLWFIKRYPIQYREIIVKTEINITKICPHIEVPNDERKHIEFIVVEDHIESLRK